MQKVLRCDCGYEIRADDDEVLVSRAREHAKVVHGMELDGEQVLELALAEPRPAARARSRFRKEQK